MKTSKDTTRIVAVGEIEPNWAMFKHRGLDCLILRHMTMGHLCGYVRLPATHPAHRALANRRKLHVPNKYHHKGAVRRAYPPDIDYYVHGGITFAGPMRFYRAHRGLWVGFDCAHLDDLTPFMQFKYSDYTAYRDITFVERECRALADQILGTITE